MPDPEDVPDPAEDDGPTPEDLARHLGDLAAWYRTAAEEESEA